LNLTKGNLSKQKIKIKMKIDFFLILVKLLPKTTKPMCPNTHTQNTRGKNAWVVVEQEKSHIHEPTPLRWKSLQREPIFKEKKIIYEIKA
jgi:hypothetical protein